MYLVVVRSDSLKVQFSSSYLAIASVGYLNLHQRRPFLSMVITLNSAR